MSHLTIISFTSDLDNLYLLAIEEANSFGGKVYGDKWKGSFSIPALGGKFEGNYEVKKDVIYITISKKPFFILHSMIEAFLKKNIK